MRSISKLARLRAAIRDLKAVEEWNGSFVGGEEKEDMWLTRLDDDVCRLEVSKFVDGALL